MCNNFNGLVVGHIKVYGDLGKAKHFIYNFCVMIKISKDTVSWLT